jgi:protein phosphatase
VLRVAEQYYATDTGRQRRANEDSLMVRAPLYVVADGMGGAQAGEVASRLAVEAFKDGLADSATPEAALTFLAQAANARIYELSHANAEQAGMGTTLTAVYVGEREVSIAHVGDSRAYCLRDGQLLKLTDDHSLVDELIRQGRLTPEEAVEHPQRSVITRALGIEGEVEVDTRSLTGQAGDVYLICSDGLTTMVSEEQVARVLVESPSLRDAGERLIATANQAGGRDNITVVLLRLEEVGPGASPLAPASAAALAEQQTAAHAVLGGGGASPLTQTQAPTQARPRMPRAARRAQLPAARLRRRGPRLTVRRAGFAGGTLLVLGLVTVAFLLALQSIYFVGTNGRGLVTLYEGLPFELPGGIPLYTRQYVSGVSASTLSAQRRSTLLNHTLRSEGDAASLIRSLELDQLE